MGQALQARLAPFILSAADQANEVQPRSIRVIRVPDYFAEYRDKGDGLASFLGTSIVAKVCTCSTHPQPRTSTKILPLFPKACVLGYLGEELRVQIRLH